MARLNRKRVEEIFTMSKQEKWAYPRIFDALKDAGVEYCETDVATHGIVYHGAGDAIPEPPTTEFTLLKPSASGLPRGHGSRRSGRYRVDMSARDVGYFGAAGQAYV